MSNKAERPKLWRVAGNMATLASEATVNRWNATPFVKESVKRGREVLRDDLGFAEAPPLERLLIEQVILCWVNLLCIPRPIARSERADDGPLRYRVLHTAALWKSGERPQLKTSVLEGDVGLAI